jgi:hypothetical protein
MVARAHEEAALLRQRRERRRERRNLDCARKRRLRIDVIARDDDRVEIRGHVEEPIELPQLVMQVGREENFHLARSLPYHRDVLSYRGRRRWAKSVS